MKYRNASAITPSDSAGLPGTISAFTVGVAGTVTVDTYGGSKGILLNCIAGWTYELGVVKIYATGTSATGINGYW
jgi:hypothetical protein